MGQSCHASDRQSESNPVRQSQFAMLGEARKPQLTDPCCIAKCKNLLDAIRLAVHVSNFSHDHICSTLGIDNGHWTRIMQARAHFPTNKIRALMELTGSLAPLQFLAFSMGYDLKKKVVEDKDEIIRELQAELARRAA